MQQRNRHDMHVIVADSYLTVRHLLVVAMSALTTKNCDDINQKKRSNPLM